MRKPTLLPLVIYGAMIGHFLMSLRRKMIHPGRVVLIPDPPREPGASIFTAPPPVPPPKKIGPRSWMVSASLMSEMLENGYRFNRDTGEFE